MGSVTVRTKKQKVRLLIMILQALIGILFFVLGIQSIAGEQSVAGDLGTMLSEHVGGNREFYLYIAAVIELISGAVLTASLFALVKTKVLRYAMNTVIILWAAAVLILDIAGQSFSSGRFDWLGWTESIVFHLILLCSLLIVRFERI